MNEPFAGGKWNKAWEVFRQINANPSVERIMGFAHTMLENIGMEAVPFLSEPTHDEIF